MPPLILSDLLQAAGLGMPPTDVDLARKRGKNRDYYGEAEPRPEDIYPNLAPLIGEIRKAKPDITDKKILEVFNNIETGIKSNLPKGVTPEQVDVEVFGRKPNLLQRVLAPALEQSGINPTSRALGLPTLLPKEAAGQAKQMGGLAPFAGQVLGDLPLIAATGGASKLLGLRPFLTDVAAGASFGALSPLMQGNAPTGRDVGMNALLFGSIGALGRKMFPGAKAAPQATTPEVIPPTQRALGAGRPPLAIAQGSIPMPESPLGRMASPFGQPASTLASPKMLTEGTGERILGDVEGMLGKTLSPEAYSPRTRVDTLRTRRELADMGIIQSVKPNEIIEEASLKAREALEKVGTIPARLANIVEDVANESKNTKNFLAGGEHEGRITLHMGFNPFEAVKDLKSLWKDLTTPASKETMRRIGQNSRERFFNAIRLPKNIFVKDEVGKRFWDGGVQKYMEGYEPATIKYHNLLDDIFKPVFGNKDKLEQVRKALDSAEGYQAATGEIRGVADRVRREFLDPIHTELTKVPGAEVRYLKDYFPHVMDRTETYKWLEKELKAAEGAADLKRVSGIRELLDMFVSHKGRFYQADEELGVAGREILGEIFNPRAQKKVGLGAIEERSANLPTYLTKDPIQLLENYANSALRKVHLEPLLKQMGEDVAQMPAGMRSEAISLIRNLSGMRHPTAVRWEGMMESLGAKLGLNPVVMANTFTAESLSRLARSAEYMRTMYGNVGGAIVNATQIPIFTFPFLAQKYGAPKAASKLVEAIPLAFQPEGRALAREMGAFRTRHAAGLEGQPRMLESMWGLIDLFAATERQVNRPITGIATYLLERGGGASHETAIRAGQKAIRSTQFMVDPTTIPRAFTGPAGRVLYQYQSFKQQGLDFFINSLDKTGKAYFVGMLLAIGGPSALPIMGGPLRELIIGAGVPELSAGLPGLGGVDVGKRINPFDAISGSNPQEIAGRTLQSSLGPVVSLGGALLNSANQLLKYGPAVYQGQMTPDSMIRAVVEPTLRELEPVALQRLASSVEVARTGELRAGQASGLKLLATTAGLPNEMIPARYGGYHRVVPREGLMPQFDPAVTALGLPTVQRTLYERVAEKAALAREISSIQRERIVEAYLYRKQTGDNGPLIEALRAAPGADLRQILRTIDLEPQERLRRGTPERMRGMLPQLISSTWAH